MRRQVNLQNTVAEMEAQHHRMLEDKVITLSNDGDAALLEAHAQIEKLSMQLDGSKTSYKKLDEVLGTTTALLRAAESTHEATQAKVKTLDDHVGGVGALAALPNG